MKQSTKFPFSECACFTCGIIRHRAVQEKNPYPPHGRSLEIPRGRVVLKVKISEAKYKVKLEFPGGQRV